VREISQAIADAAWGNPYVCDETDMAEDRTPLKSHYGGP